MVGALVGAAGIALAYWVYLVRRGEPAKALAEKVPRLHALVRDKWRIDELYDMTVVAGLDSLADTAAIFDKYVVDGIIARFTSLVVAALGTVLRAVQSGVVHLYAAVLALGIVAIGWFFVLRPQARVTIVETDRGHYAVEAAPGARLSLPVEHAHARPTRPRGVGRGAHGLGGGFARPEEADRARSAQRVRSDQAKDVRAVGRRAQEGRGDRRPGGAVSLTTLFGLWPAVFAGGVGALIPRRAPRSSAE